MSWVAAAVGIGTLGYSIYNSAHKSHKAKKLARQNKRPVYNPDGSVREVYDLTQSEMSNPQMEDYATQQLGNNAANGIDAILKSGGKADFATINGQYGSQLSPLLQSIRADRANKIASFSNAAYNVAKSNDASFQYNVDAPFKDKQQEIAQLNLDAAQAKQQAINTGISTAANYGIATAKSGTGDKSGINDGATLNGTTGVAQPISHAPLTAPGNTITPRPASQMPDGGMTLIDQNFKNFGGGGLGGNYHDGIGYVKNYNEYGDPIYHQNDLG